MLKCKNTILKYMHAVIKYIIVLLFADLYIYLYFFNFK